MTQVSIDPASGGSPPTVKDNRPGGALTHQHYTDLQRITRLAGCHPMVATVAARKVSEKSKGGPTVYDAIGRAVKRHQSPWDLDVQLGPGAVMQIGCSVHGADDKLLSLWWAPGSGTFTPEMEELARAIFFDLVEGEHLVPRTYAADFRAASGASGGRPAAASDAWEAPPTYYYHAGGSSSAPFPVAAGASAPSTSSAAP